MMRTLALMHVGVERFRALARSSPWRWSTLRNVQEGDPSGGERDRLRVWIRRPKLARVERPDGTLVRVHREQPQTVTPLSRRGDAPPITLPAPSGTDVRLDDDGLVRQRPGRSTVDTDTAMIGSYYDVALLDPVELADGHDGGPGATVQELRVVDHRGREAWEAVFRPTGAYEPRCPCCALLLSEALEDTGIRLREDPTSTYPDAHRVRIDVGTGVCVHSEQLGGTRSGAGHDITIEAVDEPLDDGLFADTPRAGWARIPGRR